MRMSYIISLIYLGAGSLRPGPRYSNAAGRGSNRDRRERDQPVRGSEAEGEPNMAA